MSSATLLCPKCEDGDLEWSWFAGSWDEPPSTDFNQSCECEFTDAELDKLEKQASEDASAQEAKQLEDEARYEAEHPIILCPVCGGEPPEHNWEVHYAELRA